MRGLLAFFKRSLREHSRSSALLVARTALAATLLIALVLYTLQANAIGAAGLEFFSTIIVINALFITAGGLTYFASAISEEKEDGTLALLRITQASSLSILLGKGGARLVDGLLLLAVQIPFTLLGVTLGGVTWTQVFAAYADLGGYLILVCTLGLLAGVVTQRTSQAVLFSSVSLGVLLFGGRVLTTFLSLARVPTLLATNIFARLDVITSLDFDGPILSDYLLLQILYSLVLFPLTWLLFHAGPDGFLGIAQKRPLLPLRLLNHPDARPPQFNPVAWKDYHFLHGGHSMARRKLLTYLGLALLLGLLIHFQAAGTDTRKFLATWGSFVAALGFWGLALEWLVATSRTLGVEKRDRTLGALMLLPDQTAGALLNAKVNVIYRLLRPATTVVVAGFILLACGLSDYSTTGLSFIFSAPAGAGLVALFLLPHAICLQLIVIHCSLRIRTASLPTARQSVRLDCLRHF